MLPKELLPEKLRIHQTDTIHFVRLYLPVKVCSVLLCKNTHNLKLNNFAVLILKGFKLQGFTD